ncbi:tyrosyl-tRNA synthetase [Nematocida homosporus]|uniref:tyrosyl-tRNA synthetase n=1 Tax=Nematocida homosporus TaxID=1912981 RepID=UPI00221E5FD1|nr:tyrosyl-tRNA synthetase [Nematocida homosporus]KAI5185226.1 tyrosyl-tRNA synthetase [Nematocida homosporus]
MANHYTVEQKYELISAGLQEILGQEELKKILAQRDLKVYWGTATTGKPHIGYLVPMLKIADFLAAGCEVTVLLADLHAVLDNMKAPLELVKARTAYYKVVITALLRRAGAPLEKIRFVAGTEFQLEKEYVMDAHKLSTLVTVHDAQRAGAEVVKQTDNPHLSGLVYPGMQALDEEYLGVDAQFGGVDQRKIFIYAEKYLPMLGYRKRIHLMNPMVPGLGAGKMSSSEESSKIGLTDTDAQIKKKISKAFCEEGNIEPNGVLSLIGHVILPTLPAGEKFVIDRYKTQDTLAYDSKKSLEADFQNRLIHPADLKQAAAKYLIEFIRPVREEIEKYPELIAQAYPSPAKK